MIAPHDSLRTGTIFGTMLSMVPNIFSEDIIRTVILAAVGAVSSFLVSICLRRLFKERE
jgi:hypothetical protein